MTVEQYSALVDLMPQIEKALETKGEKVPRPKYDTSKEPAEGRVDGAHEESEDEEKAIPVKAETKNGKRKKANIEATSDEDEDE
jgi:hypothetical protein